MEILASEILGTSKFDRSVLNMALINICDRDSEIGREIVQLDRDLQAETDRAVINPWLNLYQFNIYIPHPDQQYDGISAGEGFTRGYNIEVKPIRDRRKIPYQIPEGGHFIVIFKQKRLTAKFEIAATGIFVRPVAAFVLDIVLDPETGAYQSSVIKHPIVRQYPADWEDKLTAFLKGEITNDDLPDLVGYVDRAFNHDYRSPNWAEI